MNFARTSGAIRSNFLSTTTAVVWQFNEAINARSKARLHNSNNTICSPSEQIEPEENSRQLKSADTDHNVHHDDRPQT